MSYTKFNEKGEKLPTRQCPPFKGKVPIVYVGTYLKVKLSDGTCIGPPIGGRLEISI